jgi:hypothetical protein
LTQENNETQKKLTVARRGTTRREKVTRHTKVMDRKVFPSRNSGTIQERHLQAEHNLLCESGMADEGDWQNDVRPSKDHLPQEVSVEETAPGP